MNTQPADTHPKTRPLRVLLVEDSPDDAELLLAELRRAGYDPTHERVQVAHAMREALQKGPWDIVIADNAMPGLTGMEALRIAQELEADTPLILVSGTIDEDVAVEALKAGADDYVPKDRLVRLAPAVERAIQGAKTRRERRKAEEHLVYLNAVLRVIRDVNQLIVRETDRLRMIHDTCEILVRNQGFHGAWILLRDKASGRIEGAAAGFDDQALAAMNGLFQRNELPACCQRALDSPPAGVTVQAAPTCKGCPMPAAYKDGVGVTVPLRHETKAYGCLGVSVPPAFASDEEEASLLVEIARDIAFALHGLEAEESRRKSEEALEMIFESAPDGMVLIDAGTGRFIRANRSFCRMLGYAPEEIEDLSVADIHPSESLAHVTAEFERQLRGEISLALDIPVRRKDGSVFPANVNSASVEAYGRSCRLGLFRDITEQRKAETALRQSEKMQAVGQLAGGVAHEFNNQLAVINGFTELILRQCPDDEKFANRLQQILKAGQRASELTGQLLAYSHPEEMNPTSVNLNDVVRDTESMLRRTIGEDIQLRADLAMDLGSVRIDRGQISDAIINLASNARDAMPTGGSLIIETRNVEFREEDVPAADMQAGVYVRLSVRDTGQGMDDKTQARIFEPFYTTKPTGKGTGLGLSIVYGVVSKAGGCITVESRVGQGTTMSVFLPRMDETSEGSDAASADADEEVVGGSETILIAEDEEGVRNFLEACLEDLGYEVLAAASGEEALKRVEQDKPSIHLVISDVVMPGMHGFEFVKQLRAVCPHVKVIYLSGYSEEHAKQRSTSGSDTRVLKKPISPTTLARAVRETLDR